GRAVGQITAVPVGDNGFGFDPVMFIPDLGLTFAQLAPEVKNAHSHRGQAAREIVRQIRQRWLGE
ncbi:MAG: non-canonical purine NTP pyrophosphatase, partial [Burkholderiales bacterium]